MEVVQASLPSVLFSKDDKPQPKFVAAGGEADASLPTTKAVAQ